MHPIVTEIYYGFQNKLMEGKCPPIKDSDRAVLKMVAFGTVEEYDTSALFCVNISVCLFIIIILFAQTLQC
jgi:hypothetical protein